MGGSRGVNIGSEMSGDVYNVLVRNIEFTGSNFAARIKSARGRGGRVFNVTFENLHFTNNEFGVAINMNYGSNPAAPPLDESTPHVFDISYRNITGSALNAGFFEGLLESACRGISMENVAIESRILGFECLRAHGTSYGDVSPPSCLEG